MYPQETSKTQKFTKSNCQSFKKPKQTFQYSAIKIQHQIKIGPVRHNLQQNLKKIQFFQRKDLQTNQMILQEIQQSLYLDKQIIQQIKRILSSPFPKFKFQKRQNNFFVANFAEPIKDQIIQMDIKDQKTMENLKYIFNQIVRQICSFEPTKKLISQCLMNLIKYQKFTQRQDFNSYILKQNQIKNSSVTYSLVRQAQNKSYIYCEPVKVAKVFAYEKMPISILLYNLKIQAIRLDIQFKNDDFKNIMNQILNRNFQDLINQLKNNRKRQYYIINQIYKIILILCIKVTLEQFIIKIPRQYVQFKSIDTIKIIQYANISKYFFDYYYSQNKNIIFYVKDQNCLEFQRWNSNKQILRQQKIQFIIDILKLLKDTLINGINILIDFDNMYICNGRMKYLLKQDLKFSKNSKEIQKINPFLSKFIKNKLLQIKNQELQEAKRLHQTNLSKNLSEIFKLSQNMKLSITPIQGQKDDQFVIIQLIKKYHQLLQNPSKQIVFNQSLKKNSPFIQIQKFLLRDENYIQPNLQQLCKSLKNIQKGPIIGVSDYTIKQNNLKIITQKQSVDYSFSFSQTNTNLAKTILFWLLLGQDPFHIQKQQKQSIEREKSLKRQQTLTKTFIDEIIYAIQVATQNNIRVPPILLKDIVVNFNPIKDKPSQLFSRINILQAQLDMRPSNSSPDNLIGLYYLKKLLINKKLSIKDNNKIILIIFLLSLVTNESEQQFLRKIYNFLYQQSFEKQDQYTKNIISLILGNRNQALYLYDNQVKNQLQRIRNEFEQQIYRMFRLKNIQVTNFQTEYSNLLQQIQNNTNYQSIIFTFRWGDQNYYYQQINHQFNREWVRQIIQLIQNRYGIIAHNVNYIVELKQQLFKTNLKNMLFLKKNYFNFEYFQPIKLIQKINQHSFLTITQIVDKSINHHLTRVFNAYNLITNRVMSQRVWEKCQYFQNLDSDNKAFLKIQLRKLGKQANELQIEPLGLNLAKIDFRPVRSNFISNLKPIFYNYLRCRYAGQNEQLKKTNRNTYRIYDQLTLKQIYFYICSFSQLFHIFAQPQAKQIRYQHLDNFKDFLYFNKRRIGLVIYLMSLWKNDDFTTEINYDQNPFLKEYRTLGNDLDEDQLNVDSFNDDLFEAIRNDCPNNIIQYQIRKLIIRIGPKQVEQQQIEIYEQIQEENQNVNIFDENDYR